MIKRGETSISNDIIFTLGNNKNSFHRLFYSTFIDYVRILIRLAFTYVHIRIQLENVHKLVRSKSKSKWWKRRARIKRKESLDRVAARPRSSIRRSPRWGLGSRQRKTKIEIVAVEAAYATWWGQKGGERERGGFIEERHVRRGQSAGEEREPDGAGGHDRG